MGVHIQRVSDRVLALGTMGAVRVMAGKPSAGGDWWDPLGEGLCVVAAYQAKGAASLAASYTDLSGSGHDAGVGVAPTWGSSDGWIFNGSTQYLTTTFVPAEDHSQSIIVQFSSAVGDAGYLVGSDQAANREFGILPLYLGTQVRYWNGNDTPVAPKLAAGNLAVAGAQGYRSGSAEGGAIPAWAGASSMPLYIGCNNNAGAGEFLAVKIQALAIYDSTLTSDQVAAVAAAMAAL